MIEQLAGAAIPASALETLVLPGRVPGYSAALLDELTAAGEVVWSGAGGLPGGDGWLVLAPAVTASLLLPEPGEITVTPVHEAVLAVLDGGGALFFRALADRAAARLATDAAGRPAGRPGAGAATDQAVAAAIWDLVWAGRLTNDTLAPLRTVLGSGRPAAPTSGTARTVTEAGGERAGPHGTDGRGAAPYGGGAPMARRPGRAAMRHRGYGRAVLPSRSGPPTVSGRWSLLPPREPDQTRRLHALALTLLDRHGIVTRGATGSERVSGGFGALYPVLRAMEESGQCRRGYFVEGLGAAQFALTGAVDRMRALAVALPGGTRTPGPRCCRPGLGGRGPGGRERRHLEVSGGHQPGRLEVSLSRDRGQAGRAAAGQSASGRPPTARPRISG